MKTPKAARPFFSLTIELNLTNTSNQRVIERDNRLIERDNRLIEKNNRLIKKNNSLIEKNNSLIEKNNSLIEKNNRLIKRDNEQFNRIFGKNHRNDYPNADFYLLSNSLPYRCCF